MNILILGGSGFVGRAICNKLVAGNYLVTVPTRKRDRARDVMLLPTVTVVEADVYDTQALAQLVRGKDAVINLVGILNEKKRGGFESAHVTLTENLIAACKHAGVSRYLHMSALGAASGAPSTYLQTKAKAETLVANSGLNVTTFAPSVIFGRGDAFLNRFASLTSLTPPLAPFVLPGASAKFQPVFVEDVASAFVSSLNNAATYGQRYELAGPREYSLRELVSYVMRLQNKRHMIIGLPQSITRALATFMQFVPTQPLTPDNVKSMSIANVSKAAWPSFAGARATALEQIAPDYIGGAALEDGHANARNRAGHRK